MKFKENAQNQNAPCARVLVNEIVASRLGHLLEMPTPPVAVVEVAEVFFNAPANAKLRTEYNPPVSVGPHFGSQRLRDVYDSAPASVLEKCLNRDQFAKVVAFDVWTLNTDRKMDHCLIVRPDYHPTAYCVSSVDHGHCFGGPAWGPDIATRVGTWQPSMVAEMAQLIQGNDPFKESLEKLAAVSEAQIDEILAEIPAEWGLPAAERDALKVFVMGQKGQVGQILEGHKNSFPKWVKAGQQ